MLATKRTAGVIPKVNLRECVRLMPLPSANKAAHSGFETQRRYHQKFKTGVSLAPQKGPMSSKFFLKRKTVGLIGFMVHLRQETNGSHVSFPWGCLTHEDNVKMNVLCIHGQETFFKVRSCVIFYLRWFHISGVKIKMLTILRIQNWNCEMH